ncbi:MAG: hypothetical protein WD772_01180, partial [Pseudohongiellaceae bacterium]
LASVWVLWPWQETISFSVDLEGQLHPLQTVKISPFEYAALTGQDPRLLAVAAALVAGLVLIVGFEKLFGKSADE